MRDHTWHAIFEFFTHQIELLPWPACSPVLSPIENVGSMLAERLAQDTPPTVTPGQLWAIGDERNLELRNFHLVKSNEEDNKVSTTLSKLSRHSNVWTLSHDSITVHQPLYRARLQWE
ncbi:hypothetical protein TNCV_741581 [Trichonephila clavipes]|nr:hypothetical protein TNCV_741581 [Trichonephila clavipes]